MVTPPDLPIHTPQITNMYFKSGKATTPFCPEYSSTLMYFDDFDVFCAFVVVVLPPPNTPGTLLPSMEPWICANPNEAPRLPNAVAVGDP